MYCRHQYQHLSVRLKPQQPEQQAMQIELASWLTNKLELGQTFHTLLRIKEQYLQTLAVTDKESYQRFAATLSQQFDALQQRILQEIRRMLYLCEKRENKLRICACRILKGLIENQS